MEDTKGMPLSIQIVGYLYEDETVLGLMHATTWVLIKSPQQLVVAKLS